MARNSAIIFEPTPPLGRQRQGATFALSALVKAFPAPAKTPVTLVIGNVNHYGGLERWLRVAELDGATYTMVDTSKMGRSVQPAPDELARVHTCLKKAGYSLKEP